MRQFETTCENWQVQFPGNQVQKTDMRILNQLQLKWRVPLFLFPHGGLFKLHPDWWDATFEHPPSPPSEPVLDCFQWANDHFHAYWRRMTPLASTCSTCLWLGSPAMFEWPKTLTNHTFQRCWSSSYMKVRDQHQLLKRGNRREIYPMPSALLWKSTTSVQTTLLKAIDNSHLFV